MRRQLEVLMGLCEVASLPSGSQVSISVVLDANAEPVVGRKG